LIFYFFSLLENYQIQMKILMRKNSLVNYNEIYLWNIFSLCLSVHIDENFSLVYTERITMGNEGIKRKEEKITCHCYKRYYRQNKLVANILQ
jgi:hypothetical protein